MGCGGSTLAWGLLPAMDMRTPKVGRRRQWLAIQRTLFMTSAVLLFADCGGQITTSDDTGTQEELSTVVHWVQNKSVLSASATSLSATLPGAVGAGHLLVGVFRGAGTLSVSDNVNGAWTHINSYSVASLFYVQNSKAASANSLIVTVHGTGAGRMRIAVDEFAGVATTGALIAQSANGIGGASWSGGSTAAVPAGQLVYAGASTGSINDTFTAGSTNGVAMKLGGQQTSGSGSIFTEYALSSAAGVQNATATVSPSATMGVNGGQAVFKPATTCGNGVCDASESCSSCAQDCGACTGPDLSTPALPTVTLAANPTSISSGGSSTLSWSSTHATSCAGTNFMINGGATSGTVSVSPTVNTTYTVACTGAGGSAQATTSVAVTSTTSTATPFLGASMQGLSLGPITPSGTDNAWQDFVGTDAVYHNTLPRAPAGLFGGTAGYTDGIQIIGATGATVNAIVTDNTVPAALGVSNHALQITMVEPYDNNSMQNMYLVFPDTSRAQGMVYTSRWMWLQPDLASRGSFWMEIAETKTADPAERFQLGIVNYSPFGVPVFQMLHDVPGTPWEYYTQTWLSPTGVNTGNNGIGQTHMAPIPLGRWFRAEFAFNRSDAEGQGWMWFAITDPGSSDPGLKSGTQVYAMRGPFSFTSGGTTQNLGLNAAQPGKLINRLFMAASYANLNRSSSSPYVIKYTNIEAWTGSWPSNASVHPTNYN
jgi:hypothetical protein